MTSLNRNSEHDPAAICGVSKRIQKMSTLFIGTAVFFKLSLLCIAFILPMMLIPYHEARGANVFPLQTSGISKFAHRSLQYQRITQDTAPTAVSRCEAIIANNTPYYQLEVTVDGGGAFLINKGQKKTFSFKGNEDNKKHIITAKAFVFNKRFGRREISRKCLITFVVDDRPESLSQGMAKWYKSFTYQDFLPKPAGNEKTDHEEAEGGQSEDDESLSFLQRWLPVYYSEKEQTSSEEEQTSNRALAADTPTTPQEVFDDNDTLTASARDSVDHYKQTPGKDHILGLINEASIKYSVPSALLTALIEVESDFSNQAVSHKGALGLMQLMPATCERFEVKEPFDPRDNIQGGTRYLSYLLHEWSSKFPSHQRLELSLAAYNAGERRVERHGGIPPFKETVNYVKKVLDRYNPLDEPQEQSLTPGDSTPFGSGL